MDLRKKIFYLIFLGLTNKKKETNMLSSLFLNMSNMQFDQKCPLCFKIQGDSLRVTQKGHKDRGWKILCLLKDIYRA